MLARPLMGEPLAVDLMNTRWRQGSAEIDLLATTEGLAQWLAEAHQGDIPATEPVRQATIAARGAIDRAVAGADGADGGINSVLARGVIVRTIESGKLAEQVLFADPAWSLAWRAASDYARLVDGAPRSIRRCANAACVLHFYDPAGRRRWCSMAGCGNRAKASRHRSRQ